MRPVLYAEDEEHDAFFLRRAFQKAGVPNELYVVSDGQEAIYYLKGDQSYADRKRFPLPCFLMTDIKMPRIDGFELLKWVKSQPQFCDLPTLVLSSSTHGSDRERALSLGASGFRVKPASNEELESLVREIHHEWIKPHCQEGDEMFEADDTPRAMDLPRRLVASGARRYRTPQI